MSISEFLEFRRFFLFKYLVNETLMSVFRAHEMKYYWIKSKHILFYFLFVVSVYL